MELWSSGQGTGLSIERPVVLVHLPLFQSLGNFVHPTLTVFGRDAKRRWSLLPGVYAGGGGDNISHVGHVQPVKDSESGSFSHYHTDSSLRGRTDFPVGRGRGTGQTVWMAVMS